MKKFFRYAGMAALPLALLMPLGAQQNEGMTRQQGEQILQELREIKQLLQQQAPKAAPQEPPAPTHAKLSLEGFQMLGSKTAPMTMVEFTDYQCPFCQQFHNTAYAQIKANYIDTGKVRFFSRDFPLDFHENARRGAIAARCAAEQGKFWELRHAMIVNASQLQQDKIASYAANVKMDVAKFQTCVAADKYKAAIDKDIAEGTAAGVNGTPSFVLGRIEDGKLVGVRLVGAMPYEQFDTKIQEMLAQAAAKN
jgi:protein-disulfide isomerase